MLKIDGELLKFPDEKTITKLAANSIQQKEKLKSRQQMIAAFLLRMAQQGSEVADYLNDDDIYSFRSWDDAVQYAAMNIDTLSHPITRQLRQSKEAKARITKLNVSRPRQDKDIGAEKMTYVGTSVQTQRYVTLVGVIVDDLSYDEAIESDGMEKYCDTLFTRMRAPELNNPELQKELRGLVKEGKEAAEDVAAAPKTSESKSARKTGRGAPKRILVGNIYKAIADDIEKRASHTKISYFFGHPADWRNVKDSVIDQLKQKALREKNAAQASEEHNLV